MKFTQFVHIFFGLRYRPKILWFFITQLFFYLSIVISIIIPLFLIISAIIVKRYPSYFSAGLS